MSPKDTFYKAQKAILNGHYEEFFLCLSKSDTKRIFQNSLKLSFGSFMDDDRFNQCCEKYAFNKNALAELYKKSDFKAFNDLLKKSINALKDLKPMAGMIETLVRNTLKIGSVSSELFINEDIEIIESSDKSAWGIRTHNGKNIGPLEFSIEQGLWVIGLIPSSKLQKKYQEYIENK